MGRSSLAIEAVFRPIGDSSQLHAAVHIEKGATFFTVKGPCGEGHTMSMDEARRLRDWLTDNLPEQPDPKWRLTLDPKGFR